MRYFSNRNAKIGSGETEADRLLIKKLTAPKMTVTKPLELPSSSSGLLVNTTIVGSRREASRSPSPQSVGIGGGQTKPNRVSPILKTYKQEPDTCTNDQSGQEEQKVDVLKDLRVDHKKIIEHLNV